jgi:hypothetical protein
MLRDCERDSKRKRIRKRIFSNKKGTIKNHTNFLREGIRWGFFWKRKLSLHKQENQQLTGKSSADRNFKQEWKKPHKKQKRDKNEITDTSKINRKE